MNGLKDRNGIDIPEESIVYGKHDGGYHFFNIGINPFGVVEMISCTYGYVHNIKQKDLEGFLLIGSLEEHKHLLECD